MVWEKPWKQKQQRERSLPGRKVRAVAEEGSPFGAAKESGESQAREDPTMDKDLAPGAGSCCPMPALLATAHATCHHEQMARSYDILAPDLQQMLFVYSYLWPRPKDTTWVLLGQVSRQVCTISPAFLSL